MTFAGLAVLLSVIGIYGLTTGEVAARWREIGVRLALGASHRAVLWTVLGPCLFICTAGAAVGVAGAVAAGPSLSSLLHGVGPRDATTLVAVPTILLATGACAALLASARLFKTAPAAILRAE